MCRGQQLSCRLALTHEMILDVCVISVEWSVVTRSKTGGEERPEFRTSGTDLKDSGKWPGEEQGQTLPQKNGGRLSHRRIGADFPTEAIGSTKALRRERTG